MILWRGQRLDSTWVTNEIVSAATMNLHVRDNFNVTAPATALAVDGFLATTGLNTIAQRFVGVHSIATSQTTTSTTFTNLATTGPTVAAVQTGTKAFVAMTAYIANNTLGAFSVMGVEVSGASAIAAADSQGLVRQQPVAGQALRVTMLECFQGLTAGSNTFTAKYRVDTGTGTFANRNISIIPF